MDTREKIIPGPDATRVAPGATVVSGYFDPLLAWHAARLREIKRNAPLIVIIENPPRPILPARARAELVSSLAVVDFVIECPQGIAVDVHLEAEEQRKLNELIERVHARCRGASESR
jgi:hypothetical protein